MVKNGETGSEITKAHTSAPYKPNILSLTAPSFKLYSMSVNEGNPKEDGDTGAKKWTVIGGRKGRFLRYLWQRRASSFFEAYETSKKVRVISTKLQKACPQATNKI